MEIFMYLVSVVISLVLIRAVSSYFSTKKNLPPGPFPYPIVGNIFQIGSEPQKSLANLAKIYGPIFYLKFGQIETVVISSPSLAKEVLQTHDLSFFDRFVSKTIHAHNHHNMSIIFVPFGPLWRNLRKVTDNYLVSNHRMDATQHIPATKVKQLLSYVQKCSRSGTPVEFDKIAFQTLLDILSTLLLSFDLSDDNDTANEFKELLKCIGDEVTSLNLVDWFPILDNVYPQPLRRRVGVYFGRLFDMFDRFFDDRLLARKEKSYISKNDMLDSLLSMNKRSKKRIDRNAIKHLFMNLLGAGADTTAHTLEWAMVELFKNPETLKKAKDEIEQVIGRENMIEESDMGRLPYLRAVIKETFRLHPAAPVLVPRKAAADVEIGGYTIPKDAQVIVNAWYIGRDANVWENPEVFMPERFIGSEIDARGHHFELIPFGAGRRICPGMPLAIRMLHLMVGSLIQQFDWKFEDGVTAENFDMSARAGVTINKPPPLRVIPVQVNH